MTVSPRMILDTDTTAVSVNARVAVRRNSGATTGTRRRLNIIEGVGVTVGLTDDSADEEVEVTVSAIGSLAPGSYTVADGQWHIQYKRLQLTGSQRLTVAGTGRQIITDL